MSIKALVIAAAAATVTATAGAADTYFEQGQTLKGGDILELGLITTDGAGVVEIYDYHTGQQGKLVGSENLFSGPNPDVRVSTGLPQNRDVIAVVKIDGQIVATKDFDVN